MKYIGSKARLAKYILPFLEPYLAKVKCYVEPFVGGANMIAEVQHRQRLGIDGNYYLIAMWQALQKGWEPPSELTKEQYSWVKANYKNGYFNDCFTGFVGHNCSFSGDWFAGYAGTGESRNRCLEAKNNILKQLPKVQDVRFAHGDYSIYRYVDSLIYCDPPYYEGFKYKGSGYTFNHEDFWKWCRDMAKAGNVVFVSDYYAPDDFELLWEKEISAHAHQTKKKTSVERLYKLGDLK